MIDREGYSRRPLPAQIPWRVLFQTQQENPYQSHSTRGWYPLGSMFNHSCLPNCLWYLIGDYLFIYVCASNVRQGDELTISYCPLWIASLQERTNLLRQLDIHSCRCRLCAYDRSMMDEYENELKQFENLRALARQKKISNVNRWKYWQQLKGQYEILVKKFHERPVGFIKEFLDLQTIAGDFAQDHVEKQIKDFFKIEQESFLSRLAHLTGVSNTNIANPILLFGPQLQFLLDQFSSSTDVQSWKRLLDNLYEIYTFKCYSASDDRQRQFFTHLFQTQLWITKERKL